MSDPLGHDDQAAIEAAASKAELKRQRRDDEFKWLMDSPSGRSFVWWLLSEAGVFRNPLGHTDAMTNFRCGEMNVGQKLMAKIHELAPDRYETMVKEQR